LILLEQLASDAIFKSDSSSFDFHQHQKSVEYPPEPQCELLIFIVDG
jgi:hypothetical protein